MRSSDSHEPASAPADHGFRQDRLLLAALVVFWAAAQGLSLRGTFRVESDDATPFLQAADILHGNIWLAGWTGAPNNFYTLDVLLSVACQGLFGFGVAVLLFQCWLTYGCVLIAGLRLGRAPGSMWWISGAGLVLYLGLLSKQVVYWFTAGGAHALTLAVCLVCFSLAGRLGGEAGWLPRRFGWLAYAGLSFLALAGDPFFKYVGLLPILGAAALSAVWHGRWRALVKLSVVSGLALGAAHLFVGFLRGRGFHIMELTNGQLSFADFETIKTNLYTYVRSWWLILGAGDDDLLWLGGSGVSWLARGFLFLRLLLAVVGVLWTGKILLKRKPAGSPEAVFIDSVLLVGVGLDSAAYIFSTMPGPVDQVYTFHYLVPAAAYAAILAVRRAAPGLSRRWQEAQSRTRLLAPAILFAGLASLTPRIWELSHGQPDANAYKLVDYLESKGLQAGYGGYWESNVVSMLSGQKVRVAAMSGDETGQIFPLHYLSKDAWYDAPANFVVSDPADTVYAAEPSAIRVFGPPAETARVGPYHVLIWDHDIHDALKNSRPSLPAKFSIDLLQVRQEKLAPGVSLNADNSVTDAQSYPQSTPIMASPPMQIPPGRYQVTFVLEASDASAKDSLLCNVTSHDGKQVLAARSISGDLLVGRATRSTITLPFNISGSSEVCEFRVWKTGGMKLTLQALVLEGG